jgi:LuxR family maltose regulon positive regulatory protein
MAVPLLRTKLYIPPTRPAVPRPRLLDRLNAGLGPGYKLTLLSAPAGFGKTTLLSEWINQVRLPMPAGRVAWLSLDEGDDDSGRFLAYLISALQTIRQDIGEGVLDMLPSLQPHPSPTSFLPRGVESVLIALINEIAAALDAGAEEACPHVLVLDDYHLVNAPSIHRAMVFLLDHMPPQLRLIIAGRTDPPLPLARLRAQGHLVELRADDLRFTAHEAAAFLNQMMGLGLSAGDVAILQERTEGWVAGLQLAALSLQGQDPERIPAIVQAFSGSHRFVLDYLTEEVLPRQSEQVRTFLLKTAILDQLSGPLCEAVSGLGEAQDILEGLEAANLFLAPLDTERRWYRYHPLFADFLRARLSQEAAGLDCSLGELHARAAGWYEENGLVTEAIDHALQAQDHDWAARLIEGSARRLLLRSEIGTIIKWAEALPEASFRARPRLCISHAWALVASGRLDAAEERLQLARTADDTGAFRGEMAAIQATLTAFRGESQRAAELARQALVHLPGDDAFLRGIVAANLGIPYMLDGDVATAAQAFAEAARMSQKAGNLLVAVLSLCQVAELQIVQGRLHQAAETYGEAEKLALGKDGRPLPMAGMVYAGLGEVLREWNDLANAARYLEQAIELTRRWHTLEVGTFDSHLVLARVRQAQGDAAGALELVSQAEELAVKLDAMILDDVFVAIAKARIWLAQGNLEAVIRWADTAGLLRARTEPVIWFEGEAVHLPYHLQELVAFVLARVFTLQGRPARALALLEPILTRAEELGRTKSVVETLILQALALHTEASVVQAVGVLERALTLAESGNLIRIFLDEGERMAALLSRVRDTAPPAGASYADKLLAAFGDQIERKSMRSDLAQLEADRRPSSLVEPLGERELEILRLIAAGFSNREIAAELVIALSTVKWHINNLYSKLGVHSRTQAVARGRDLALL